MEDNMVYLKAKIDTSAMDEVTRKAEHLNELLKEASSLLDELDSKREIKLLVEIEN